MGPGKGRARRTQTALGSIANANKLSVEPLVIGRPARDDREGVRIITPVDYANSGFDKEPVSLSELLMRQGLMNEKVAFIISPAPSHPDFGGRSSETIHGVIFESEIDQLLSGGKKAGLLLGGRPLTNIIDVNWGWDEEIEIDVHKLEKKEPSQRGKVDKVEF